jgi:hypothetical protein
MHKKTITLPFLTFILLFLSTNFGCGKGFNDDYQEQEDLAPGDYVAFLKPLNSRMGKHQGVAHISISESQFWVRIKFKGKVSKTMHAQYLHVRGPCPDMSDDLNRDGYVDFIEAQRKVGPVLIPLDANLNTQIKGIHEFPILGRLGSYYYSEASHSKRVIQDLRGKSVLENLFLTKLKSDEELSLEKRVIVIYGIDENIRLPDTVKSYAGYPSQFTLPIACGELVEGIPGSFQWFN